MLRRRPQLARSLQLALLLPLVAWPVSAHDGQGGEGEPRVVAATVPGGPADLAGLTAGDRILGFDGRALATEAELAAFLAARAPGEVVRLAVERRGERTELELTLGERPDGGALLGLSLSVAADSRPAGEEAEVDAAQCTEWLRETYQAERSSAELGIDLGKDVDANRACVAHDLARMPEKIPLGWCDNVFKAHCSGLDLLAAIGDHIVARCAAALSSEIGTEVGSSEVWITCAEPKIYEAYAVGGRVSDVATCREILTECGDSRAAGARDR